MKKTQVFAILYLVIGILFFGCEKDEEDNPDNMGLNITKFLPIDTVKRAYYDSFQNRYESNTFTADSTVFNYSVNLESGVLYRVLLYGFMMDKVDLTLLDLDSIVYAEGVQANVGYTAQFFTFEGIENDTMVIQVRSEDSYNLNKTFYLSFEEVGTYVLTWKGYNWICDGDWEVNTEGHLVCYGHSSGFSKWAKLTDTTLATYNAELEIFIEDGNLSNFVGMAVEADDDINQMINLPRPAKQFKIRAINAWEMWWINSNSVGREWGNLNNIYLQGTNYISADVQIDSISTFVNQEMAISIFNNMPEYNGFYITFEDTEKDSCIYTNIDFQ